MLPRTPLQRRLAFTASRRSMLEMERLLARYLADHLTALDDAGCQRLLTLLETPDADLLDWLTGVTPPPPDSDGDLLRTLGRYCRE